MRTLSANIAVEMPESEVDSTHYRVLFLAALVLFIFTFLFNTVGELVRQRLRRKYSSL
jgi:phosphate transport system permease protein